MKSKLKPVGLIALAALIGACAQNATKETKARKTASSEAEKAKAGEETPWTTWSKKGNLGGLLVLSHIRKNLLANNLHDAHVDYKGYGEKDCSQTETKYRSADGTCTDTKNAFAGAAGTAFGRNVPPEFIDKEAQDNLMTPNPALVSQEFFTRDEFKPVPFLNMLAASWIQFMNHDWLTHGKNAESRPHRIETANGEVEVERTRPNEADVDYKSEFGKTTLNEVTHWWDGSQVYGSNQNEQNKVRSFSKGRMATVKVNGRELLPKDSEFNARMNKQNQGLEVVGFRDNMWVGLSMLHHLFVLEHNVIADMLVKKHVKYDEKKQKYIWNQNGWFKKALNAVTRSTKGVKELNEKELDEHVFQVARLINSALMAKIHTVEWTPAILANKSLKTGMYANWYGLINPQTWTRYLKALPGMDSTDWFAGINGGYVLGGIVGDKTNNYGVPFSITEEFTSVYRLHSLLPENLNIKTLAAPKNVSEIALAATRNEYSYEMMSKYDLKDLFYSFGTQHPGQLVLNNFPKFMQKLEIPGLGNMDLAMVDVLRDRERGVPRYNQFRRAIGLKPISKYADFFMDGEVKDERQQKIVEKFRNVYGLDAEGRDNVEMIDLLVGTSAEEVRPKNFGFGETQFQIFILMASRRLMADRFYTSNYREEYYTKAGLKWVDDEGWMHKVIIRHMPELAPKLKGLETAFNPWKN
jgi:hypothetical protein